jgi:AraC-like DNA-binding protein
LLARGIAPADVAAALGFADQSHLTRTFGRTLGITPGRYQQETAPLRRGVTPPR